jgi:hypothetical protein
VAPASAYNGTFDHTSIPQFLAEMFGDDVDYSPELRHRQDAGIKSVSDALTLCLPRAVVVMPPL